MGYTHYWYTSLQGIPKEPWKAICTDVNLLLANLPAHSVSAGDSSGDPLAIAWESDQPEKAPEVSANRIRFNGQDGGRDLGHETFLFERHPQQDGWSKNEPEVFAFCKTARKPYDLVVCGVLIVAARYAGDYVRISSDGDQDEWQPALDWVHSVLGDGYDLPKAVLGR